MKFIYFLSLISCVFSFKSFNFKTRETKLKDSINPLQLKSLLEKQNIGQLIKRIDEDDVENIYFTNDMKTLYARKDINGDGDYNIDDYTVITTDPSVADLIIEHANENKIQTTILEPVVNPIQQFLGGIYGLFDALFVPIIVISIARAFFSRPNMGPMNPMGSGSLNPFNGEKNNDKENMIKANISLSSWGGSPEIFQECTEIVSYLNNRTLYEEAGAEIPRGILLEGPPGTGKTLIAKAIASETDANFISVASSEFVELFVGMGASKVRSLFKQARDNAPSIVFIDEIDAVGKQRGTGINMGNDEREQTLNQILAEMDGFAQNDNVIVIAATNRRDVLDAALLRPGRFDRIINVPLPDKPSREAILKTYIDNKKVEKDVSIDMLAELTAGYSGAQLKNLVNEAAINAVRELKTVISEKNLFDALEKLTVGIVKKTDTRSEEAIRRVALHEVGHAFLAATFSEYFQLKKVSIQSTYSGAGGYTIFSEYPEIIESGLYTKDMLKKRLVVALGCKAAEYVFYGDKDISLGATQDLKQANSLAKQMIGNYGMGETLKTFYNENTDNGRNPFLGRSLATGDGVYSENLKQTFDEETRKLVDEAYKEAVNMVYCNKNKMNVLANILMSATNMDGEFFMNYLDKKQDCSSVDDVSPANCDATEDSY